MEGIPVVEGTVLGLNSFGWAAWYQLVCMCASRFGEVVGRRDSAERDMVVEPWTGQSNILLSGSGLF